MSILKTDQSRFRGIADYKYHAHFLDYEGAQMHYIDEGQSEDIFLALHGQPSWSYLYRKFIPVLDGYRFIAPDLIGFGKSDKYQNWQDYSFEKHLRSLELLVDSLKIENINLIVQDWGGLLGLSLLGQRPELFRSVTILNTYLPKGKSLPLAYRLWKLYCRYHPSLPVGKIIQRFTYSKLSKEVIDAYNAPFPDKLSKTGPKSFPALVPSNKQDPALPYLLKAREVLSNWTKPALVLFSANDPVFSGIEDFFMNKIPSCKNQPKIIIQEAGHFLQEDKGEEIANYIKLFMEGKLPSRQY